jgi:hypothetical protein
MKHQCATRLVARLALVTLSTVLVASAFLRGSYLLGFGCGMIYVAITVGLLWLLARSVVLTERPSLVRAAAITALSLPVAFAMAYPASINPDVQHFINKHATDRAARKELIALFASDPAYSELSISTAHLKVVNITIRGSLNDWSDLYRLRTRIAGECRVLNHCPLHWDVTLREPAQRIEGLDSELWR